MAASITLGTVAVATNGKTLTATISGGTGTGYAITNAIGLVPHLSGGQEYAFTVASVGVVGTTLTVNLATPVGTGETFLLDITTGSNLTDSGANTPTGQTNVAVTNNSSVTVTTVLAESSPGSFEMNGLALSFFGALLSPAFSAWDRGDYRYEFVADCTEAAALSYISQTTHARVDGGADTTITAAGSNWGAKALTSTPLAAGKHLFQVDTEYFYGVRLSGGARTMHVVPTPKRTIKPNTVTSLNGIPQTTPLAVWGAHYDIDATRGSINSSSYGGMQLEFGFTGTGVEVSSLVMAAFQNWAASIDGGYEGALIDTATPTGSPTNITGMVQLAAGLTNAAHTITATLVSAAGNTTSYGVRIINGTKTAASSSIGASSLSVNSVAAIAVNDWVRIDRLNLREWRQVTAITGSGPYTLTLGGSTLAIAHAAGVAVTSYSAPAGTITTYAKKNRSALRAVAMGNSNTQGANEYGGAPDSNGVYYSGYDPRASAIYQACDLLNMDVANLGVQGTDTVNQAARAPEINTFSRSSYDFVIIMAGTNDVGSNQSPTSYQANVQTEINACTGLNVGGKILLVPVYTPVGTTNANGLNTTTIRTALQNLVAANPSKNIVYAANAYAGFSGADLADALHFNAQGRAKLATNLQPYLGGAVASSSAGFLVLC